MSKTGSKQAKGRSPKKKAPRLVVDTKPARAGLKKLQKAIKAAGKDPAVKKAIRAAKVKLAVALEKAAPLLARPAPDDVWAKCRIQPGRWRMANGSIAVVTGPCTISYGVDKRDKWYGWKGHLERHPDGEGLNWNLEGRRTDVAGVAHEHDLISRAKS